ncbi:MAG TPA: phosphatidylglycerol lysyltransferase domain-containing protein [Acidimicrobiales bacterium]|nr:phosphatidylglycerol lysyltransferase domain-containing protein [Acidimicrobiales bacterium]
MASDRCTLSCTPVAVPLGGRVVVAGDLFLTAFPTRTSAAASRELARAIEGITGPGVLVVAGNLFELSNQPAEELRAALRAHSTLAEVVKAWGRQDDHRVILLPGTRDRAICYDPATMASAAAAGFEVALSVDLGVETASGRQLVRVEPGWRFDPLNSFADPTDPRDTPLGHHAVYDLFPAIKSAKTGWLEGIDRLADPAGLPRFVTSRLMYRRFGRYGWLLLLPIAVAVLARIPEVALFGSLHIAHDLRDVTISLALGLLAVAVLLAVVNHRVWAGPGSALLGPPGDHANDSARDAARSLVAEGYAGLVTGHTLRAELARVGTGFFANTGACAEVVEERAALLGMPPVFVRDEQFSFVEIDAGARSGAEANPAAPPAGGRAPGELEARLHLSRQQRAAGSRLERVAAGRRRPPVELAVVASFPLGASWPPIHDPTRHRKLIRRLAGAVVLLSGILDLVTALVPVQVRGHLHPYLGYIPLGASEAAGALDAVFGIALLLLARGLRRGQRLAWAVSVGIEALTSVLHLVRGGQILPALVALAVVAGLVWARDSFRGRFDPPSMRAGLWTLVGGAVGVTAFTTFALWFGVAFYRRSHHHTNVQSLPLRSAFLDAAGGLIGVSPVQLPDTVADFLTPALLAVGLCLAAVGLLLVFRPVVDRRLSRHPGSAGAATAGSAAGAASANAGAGYPLTATAGHAEAEADFERARDIVRRRGGTLDYFALRSDKQHYFDRDSVVAYAIRSGVCLVSPDPVGPPEERERLWAGFRRFADEHGWAIAVLAAGREWLPIYRQSGMRDLYIGDEGVVDVRKLSLEGGSKKGLRQAVNRIAKYGYTISFHDPAHVDPTLAEALRSVMTQSRRGGVERGFSMTLGRVFDPRDEGLLLAVASDPTGHPVAFCQFVPAPAIDGYSLDLMRRDNGDHPNGLFDFILVRTMEHLRETGHTGLGLNFAMMRAVLAGEAGAGLSVKVERWVLRRMSDTMQIESLWRFNAKFDPEWQPRFVAWDSAEQSLGAALAIAKAESFWELPIIGRFLVPAAPEEPAAENPADSAVSGASRR